MLIFAEDSFFLSLLPAYVVRRRLCFYFVCLSTGGGGAGPGLVSVSVARWGGWVGAGMGVGQGRGVIFLNNLNKFSKNIFLVLGIAQADPRGGGTGGTPLATGRSQMRVLTTLPFHLSYIFVPP